MYLSISMQYSKRRGRCVEGDRKKGAEGMKGSTRKMNQMNDVECGMIVDTLVVRLRYYNSTINNN